MLEGSCLTLALNIKHGVRQAFLKNFTHWTIKEKPSITLKVGFNQPVNSYSVQLGPVFAESGRHCYGL